MRTMKFCSAVFGVMSRLSVTNKIHRLHGAAYVVRRPQSTNAAAAISAIIYTLPSKCWWHSTVQQWSMPKRDTRWKSLFLPLLGVPVGMLPQRLVWRNLNGVAARQWKFFKDMLLFIRFDRTWIAIFVPDVANMTDRTWHGRDRQTKDTAWWQRRTYA